MTHLWLAADYHLPGTYSLRIPLSSDNNAQIMPAPGPATVRLALLRTAIELFGLQSTRTHLFPSLRAIAIRVRPPAHIGITPQRLQAHKWSAKQEQPQVSIIMREAAHTQDLMTIYVSIPQIEQQHYTRLLQAIGYWGQTDSLATCLGVSECAPVPGEHMVWLARLSPAFPVQPFFICLTSEFRQRDLSWEEVVEANTSKESFLRLELGIWPLLYQRRGEEKLLTWCPLPLDTVTEST